MFVRRKRMQALEATVSSLKGRLEALENHPKMPTISVPVYYENGEKVEEYVSSMCGGYYSHVKVDSPIDKVIKKACEQFNIELAIVRTPESTDSLDFWDKGED